MEKNSRILRSCGTSVSVGRLSPCRTGGLAEFFFRPASRGLAKSTAAQPEIFFGWRPAANSAAYRTIFALSHFIQALKILMLWQNTDTCALHSSRCTHWPIITCTPQPSIFTRPTECHTSDHYFDSRVYVYKVEVGSMSVTIHQSEDIQKLDMNTSR